jgi:hypothetical protein
MSFEGAGYFDGFAAGLDAEEHAFEISFGTLDVMAAMIRADEALSRPYERVTDWE